MITPKEIGENFKYLKSVKVTLLQIVLYGAPLIAGVYGYTKMEDYVRDNKSEVTSIKKDVSDIKEIVMSGVATQDTSINPVIREMQGDVLILKRKTSEVYQKVDVLGEEFPAIQKRFDDIEKGFQLESFEKKNEIDLWTPYTSQLSDYE